MTEQPRLLALAVAVPPHVLHQSDVRTQARQLSGGERETERLLPGPMTYMNATVALFLAASLAGCSIDNAAIKAPSSDQVADAPARVAAADWSRAETITVALSNFRFTPDKLELRRDSPYRLHLENRSGGSHTFTSKDFFSAVAVQKLPPGAESATTSSLKSIELAAGEQKDLYLVPVKPGTYDFDCSEFLHDTFGMTGQITIR